MKPFERLDKAGQKPSAAETNGSIMAGMVALGVTAPIMASLYNHFGNKTRKRAVADSMRKKIEEVRKSNIKKHINMMDTWSKEQEALNGNGQSY